MKIVCENCNVSFEKEKRRVNEALKHGRKIYCSKECFKIKNRVNVPCRVCGKMIERLKSQLSINHFCSHSCSASYTNKIRGGMKPETKIKISNALLGITRNMEVVRCCTICGKNFSPKKLQKRWSKSKTCNSECASILRSRIGKKTAEESIKAGKHKGWCNRNTTSYPEKFFEKVLINSNIIFEKNYKVAQSSLGKDSKYYYFLDFYLPEYNIDLEIDGKQHSGRKEYDEVRDFYISKLFLVYRIKWNNINTDKGKETMKRKIEELFLYLKNLN
jgi:very-short-patch-repair endonuclease